MSFHQSESYQNFSSLDDDQYDLIGIYLIEEITNKRAKNCMVCGRNRACCVWRSTRGGPMWKYCLDCQDDNFPEWHFDWNSFYLINKKSSPSLLSDEHKHIIRTTCRKCDSEVTLLDFPLKVRHEEEGEGKEEEEEDQESISYSNSISNEPTPTGLGSNEPTPTVDSASNLKNINISSSDSELGENNKDVIHSFV